MSTSHHLPKKIGALKCTWIFFLSDAFLVEVSQTINNHPNSIVTLRRSRQSWNKIHSNFLPLPLENMKWLQQTWGSLVQHLNLLTTQKLLYKLGNLTFYIIPTKVFTKIMVHLWIIRMYCIWGTEPRLYPRPIIIRCQLVLIERVRHLSTKDHRHYAI